MFCAVWFYTLAARTLVPTDEGRYAEMDREMVSTNDWITPRLNGIKYFEKPPLQTWMNAPTFRVFGLIPIPIHNVPNEIDGFFRLARRGRSE